MRSLPARRLAGATAVAAAAVVALAAPAFAHVTVQPGTAAPGDYTAIAFRVPDESDTASTAKVEVDFPMDHPVASVFTQPVPGWTASVEKQKLDKPIKNDDGEVDQAVSKITWTADPTAKLGPGQFQDFRVSLGPLPTDTDKLVFKALQTYDNGDIVRWIDPSVPGQPEPEHPAPTLILSKPAAAAPAAAKADPSDSTARALGAAGIVVGVVGAALGALGLRRRNA